MSPSSRPASSQHSEYRAGTTLVPRDEDLDAEGFGYWPEQAQAAILRRDEEIKRLIERYDALWQEQEHPFDKSEFDRLREQHDRWKTVALNKTTEVDGLIEQLEAVTRERDHFEQVLADYRTGRV